MIPKPFGSGKRQRGDGVRVTSVGPLTQPGMTPQTTLSGYWVLAAYGVASGYLRFKWRTSIRIKIVVEPAFLGVCGWFHFIPKPSVPYHDRVVVGCGGTRTRERYGAQLGGGYYTMYIDFYPYDYAASDEFYYWLCYWVTT